MKKLFFYLSVSLFSFFLVEEAHSQQDDTRKYDSLFKKAEAYEQQQRYYDAINCYNSAADLRYISFPLRTKAFLHTAKNHMWRGDFKLAKSYFMHVERAVSLKDTLYADYGKFYYEWLLKQQLFSSCDSIYEKLNEHFTICKPSKTVYESAFAERMQWFRYRATGNLQKALFHIRKADSILNTGDRYPRLYSTVQNCLGVSLDALADYKNAANAYEKGLKTAKKHGYRDFSIQAGANLAITYKHLGLIDSTEVLAQNTIKLIGVDSAIFKESFISARTSLIDAYAARGRIQQLFEAEKSLMSFILRFSGRESKSYGVSLHRLAKFYADYDTDSAEYYYKRGLQFYDTYKEENPIGAVGLIHGYGLFQCMKLRAFDRSKNTLSYGLQLSKEFLGEENPYLPYFWEGLGIVYSELYSDNKNLKTANKAQHYLYLSIQDSLYLKEQSPGIYAYRLHTLANFKKTLNEFSTALKLNNHAFQILKAFNPEDRFLGNIQLGKSEILRSTGKYSEALQLSAKLIGQKDFKLKNAFRQSQFLIVHGLNALAAGNFRAAQEISELILWNACKKEQRKGTLPEAKAYLYLQNNIAYAHKLLIESYFKEGKSISYEELNQLGISYDGLVKRLRLKLYTSEDKLNFASDIYDSYTMMALMHFKASNHEE